MAYSEDHIALAAEYALGTLDADERAQVETLMSGRPGFHRDGAAWEHRLGVLNQMVGSVEPRPEVWDRIRAAVGLSEQQAPLVLPEACTAAVARRARARAGHRRVPFERHPPVEPGPALAQVASFTTAIAAALVALIAVGAYQPDLLPDRLRPAAAHPGGRGQDPADAGAAVAQYVAVLQKEGGSPAFILTVDGATRNFTVRKVGAAARARQEFRTVADLGQAAAAALARRDRQRRFHRASGAGGLRRRPRQQRDLCGDDRAGRRIAGRQSALGAGLCRQAGRDRAAGGDCRDRRDGEIQSII